MNLISNSESKEILRMAVDVKLAYLQSEKPLIRKIFITNPAPKFDLSPQACLELLKPIYGLVDSRDQWNQTLDDHIQINLEMTCTIIDPLLYCNFENNHIIGINSSYVDDLLRTGTNECTAQADATLERFGTTLNDQPPFIFAGTHITEKQDILNIS